MKKNNQPPKQPSEQSLRPASQVSNVSEDNPGPSQQPEDTEESIDRTINSNNSESLPPNNVKAEPMDSPLQESSSTLSSISGIHYLSSPTSSSKPSKLPKKYYCKICNQGFTRKHNMVSHELIHSSSKPHVCNVCDLTFRRIHDLKRHEKLHTGEKPFICTRCDRKFARPDALTRHLNSPNACNMIKERRPSTVQILPSGSSGGAIIPQPPTGQQSPPIQQPPIYIPSRESPSVHARPLMIGQPNSYPPSNVEMHHESYHSLPPQHYIQSQSAYPPYQQQQPISQSLPLPHIGPPPPGSQPPPQYYYHPHEFQHQQHQPPPPQPPPPPHSSTAPATPLSQSQQIPSIQHFIKTTLPGPMPINLPPIISPPINVGSSSYFMRGNSSSNSQNTTNQGSYNVSQPPPTSSHQSPLPPQIIQQQELQQGQSKPQGHQQGQVQGQGQQQQQQGRQGQQQPSYQHYPNYPPNNQSPSSQGAPQGPPPQGPS